MTKETVIARSIRLLCVGSLAAASLPALAQSEAPVQQVMITGSRIASPNAESPSPLQVLSSADIAASGATNLQELLQKNPTLGTPTVSRTNSNFQTSSAGVSTVNLRNLGTSRTLVLVNGRRYVSGIPGETAVDLNTIPTDFIERVELLTGGASATYGSDAVAGVVNIILKKNFNGVLIDAQAGESSKNDDKKRKLSLTFGTSSADGGSNIMGHFGYSKQGAVMSKDRPASAVDQNSAFTAADPFKVTRPFYSGFAPQGRFFHDTGSYTYDKAGNPIPWNQNGTNGVGATGFNRSEFRAIAVPTDRYLFATNGNLALGENHSAFFEGTYAATRVSTNIEPFPLGSDNIYEAEGGQVPAEFYVPTAPGVFSKMRNPIVPQYLWDRISDTDGDGLRDYFFTRRMSEVGNRTSKADRDTFRLATGLKGSLAANWNYEAYVAYGQTKESQTSNGQVNVLNFRNALEAVEDINDVNNNGSTTDAICRDATARQQGCQPINVFGFGSISPAALAYVSAPGSLNTKITQKLAGASVSGQAWELPAGPLGIAAGFEYRKEESSAEPDALTQAGLNAGNALPPTFGNFDVRELFVETRVPLLKDKPFARELSFLGAFRRGDYSTVGKTSSWNAGFEWSPVSDVKFRGTRALSTRAPNINELFQPPQQTFPADITDPCEGITATTPGAAAAACRAAPGVMANIAANGGVFTLTQADKQGISGYDRGNPNLHEEKGRSTTVGVVWTPRSIPVLNKFTFTADYFDIKISDAIVPVPRQFALENCYGGDGSFCNTITRRPAAVGPNNAGSLEFIDAAVNNSGGKATEGVDLTASWADRLGPGRLSARLAWTWLRDGYDIPLPGADKDYFAGELGAAKNRGQLNLAYKMGQWGLSAATTFIGKSALDDQYLIGKKLARNSVRVGSKTYQDFQLTYAPWKKTEFYLGVDNAFDTKAPPIVSGLPDNVTGTETDAATYDPIGRRYYLGVRVTL
jgi:outer membrane receptor protein involved in Fe transport